jgi:hypothetical protein
MGTCQCFARDWTQSPHKILSDHISMGWTGTGSQVGNRLEFAGSKGWRNTYNSITLSLRLPGVVWQDCGVSLSSHGCPQLSNHIHSETRQITIAIIITSSSRPSSSQCFFAVYGSDIVNHRGGRFDVFCDFNASKVEAVCSLSRPRPMQPNENRPQYQLHPGPHLDCRGVQHNTNRSTERLRGKRRGELGADNAGGAWRDGCQSRSIAVLQGVSCCRS